MESKEYNFIDMAELDERCIHWSENFKQVHIQKIMHLDQEKPKIKRFLRTFVKIEIIDTKIKRTSKGISKENQILTGLKLMVEGKVIENLEYISKDADQPVFVTDFHIPFSTFVILGKEFDEYSKIKVTPYIENVYIRQMDERKVFQSILFTIDAIALS